MVFFCGVSLWCILVCIDLLGKSSPSFTISSVGVSLFGGVTLDCGIGSGLSLLFGEDLSLAFSGLGSSRGVGAE